MIDEKYIKANKELIYRYSEFSVCRKITYDLVVDYFLKSLRGFNNDIIEINGNSYIFFFKKQEWETNFFNRETYNLKIVLFDHFDLKELADAISIFISKFDRSKNFCFFIEIPSEDIRLIQALNINKWRLIETRLHYYIDDLTKFEQPRFKVRMANHNDIPNLKSVAKKMRNKFDRFHADLTYDLNIADKYLSTYIENSINGFVDYIMVPAENGVPSDSFLTANLQKSVWDELKIPISKMILSAVSSETNRGWYKKLIIEMTYKLSEAGAEVIYMNTQSTNIPVIYTWENLGYKLGRSTHILSYSEL